MFSGLLRGAGPLLLFFSTVVHAQSNEPITAADLRRHVEVLASDEYQGRAPGSAGERRTIDYIAAQFRARGLEPAGDEGGWFQALRLTERFAGGHQLRWTARGRPIEFDANEIALLGRGESERVADAPVVFAGHGARLPEHGIDQLAGVDLRGAVALILLQGPDVPGFPSLAARTQALTEAGAAAVIAIVGPDVSWGHVVAGLRRGTTRLDEAPMPRITGTMTTAAAQRLLGAAGQDLERLLNAQAGPSFRAVTLPVRASIDVQTRVNRFTTHNVVGRLRGSGGTGQSLLYLGHWDHFGLCRPEGVADRICNGAVDNASGIATLIEVAGRLAAAPRLQRDVLFLATTAEEVGLLGATYFAAHPPVPIRSIVAALNIDTVAIHPRGEPVAVIGRGDPALDMVIDTTVAAMGRRIDPDQEAAAFVQRQDGWALARVGVPAVMVGGSFSNLALLNAFLDTTYHGPDDEVGPGLPLEGAAEDANLLAALGRRLADPAVYRRPMAAR